MYTILYSTEVNTLQSSLAENKKNPTTWLKWKRTNIKA